MRYKFLTFILLSSSLLFSQEDKIVQADGPAYMTPKQIEKENSGFQTKNII